MFISRMIFFSYVWNTRNTTFSVFPRGGTAFFDFDDSAVQVFGGLFIDSKYKDEIERNLRDNHNPKESELAELGFLTLADEDEVMQILEREKEELANKDPELIHNVIALGMGCNYSCSYCFEKNRLEGQQLSKELCHQYLVVVNDILRNAKCCKTFHVTWFGGEPLLYLDQIECIGSGLLEICKNYGVELKTSIITNGKFLDARSLEVLKKYNLRSVQVTIDGLEEYYCNVKGATPKDFQDVISNVVRCAEETYTSIRINVSNNTIQDAYDVADLLYGDCHAKVHVYTAMTRVYEDEKAVCDGNYEWYINFDHDFRSYIRDTYGPNLAERAAPDPCWVACGGISKANMCIGPDGKIYRCQETISIEEEVIGDLYNGITSSADEKYYSYQHPEQCLECALFPVCMGGCARNQATSVIHCDQKAMIREYIDREMRHINMVLAHKEEIHNQDVSC